VLGDRPRSVWFGWPSFETIIATAPLRGGGWIVSDTTRERMYSASPLIVTDASCAAWPVTASPTAALAATAVWSARSTTRTPSGCDPSVVRLTSARAEVELVS